MVNNHDDNGKIESDTYVTNLEKVTIYLFVLHSRAHKISKGCRASVYYRNFTS